MTNKLVLERIDIAHREVAEAARSLETLLRSMQDAPRAEKTTISCVVKDAFGKLQAAQTRLLELQSALADPPA